MNSNATSKKRKFECVMPLDSKASEALEDIKRKLSTLSREQLLDALARACVTSEVIYDQTNSLLEASPTSRRLMIRNIAFTTSDESLENVFLQFGQVEDFTICRDRKTGKSKGYGFVTLKTIDSVNAVMNTTIELDGRTLAVKLAADPASDAVKSMNDASRCKLFIRNLSDVTDDNKLYNELVQFGEISEAVVVKKPDTKESKGYGFVTFARSEDAARALQQSQRVIDGRMTFMTLATPSFANKSGNRIGAPSYTTSSSSVKKPMSVQSGPNQYSLRQQSTFSHQQNLGTHFTNIPNGGGVHRGVMSQHYATPLPPDSPMHTRNMQYPPNDTSQLFSFSKSHQPYGVAHY